MILMDKTNVGKNNVKTSKEVLGKKVLIQNLDLIDTWRPQNLRQKKLLGSVENTS